MRVRQTMVLFAVIGSLVALASVSVFLPVLAQNNMTSVTGTNMTGTNMSSASNQTAGNDTGQVSGRGGYAP